MASSVLSRPTVFRRSQLGFYFFLSKKILAFDLSRWVGLCRVFSLVCGVSALPLQRQDVISVMSVQGFTVSYWLFFTGPMREPGSVSMNWQTHVLFSSPECIGLLLTFCPLHSAGVAIFPQYVLVAHSCLMVL